MPHTQLHLVVTNPEMLTHGCRPRHVFDTAGGSVGCENTTWILRDAAGEIAPRHFDVVLRDGHFCITDHSGKTHLNGDPRPMGVGRVARLGEGDRIDIGSYRLGVSLSELAAASLAGPDAGGSDILNAIPPSIDASEQMHPDQWRNDEAIPENTHYGQSPRSGFQGDGASATSEAVVFASAPDSVSADALAALEDGLGAPLHAPDAHARNALLREIGQTLRAALEGLSTLQACTPENASPIEDNPLRLGLDHAGTVQALFGLQRSPFHLAPAAAVRDGVAAIERHHHALQAATDAGLSAVLDAFAPQGLAQRFERYAAANAVRNGEWLWSMYDAYYREVMAARAQGAQRLFRGAFDEAYERTLRAERGGRV